MELIAPGVWKIRLGSPEALTPLHFRAEPICEKELQELPAVQAAPFSPAEIKTRQTARGFVLELPLADSVQLYGLGLQLKSVNQTGLKKMLRVNSDPVADTGDSHAPVPFLVSNAGWALYVDSARYVTFYCGTHVRNQLDQQAGQARANEIATDTETLYAGRQLSNRQIVVEIPAAKGVDLYLFAGPTMTQAVQRYNLFSGGGCIPALWGLGVWYRAFGRFNQDQAAALARQFRERQIPCDVFGLEPGWQTQAYSCSFVWSPERFPNPDKLIAETTTLGFKLNLWEHVFTHPTSPIYKDIKPLSGDYEVWGGVVPDLSLPKAVKIFADYHDSALVSHGIKGFKLDECDHSDFIKSPWSFPEISTFPSGLDGEQMHSTLGIFYQRAIYSVFRKNNIRTYSEVRSAHALAAPYPFVLYSDLYEHRDFIRGVVNMGFSGLLWTPEVRDSKSTEELVRRVQAAMMSPQALINAWYIPSPPWQQTDRAKNNAGELMPEWEKTESIIRDIFRLRMRLIPYLYAAFARYRFEGLPPFRALVMDYPSDPNVYAIDDQYMMGDDILVAPIFAGQTERNVYLPAGDWYDFYTHARVTGGQSITVQADINRIPLFVKAGALIALAEPVDFIQDKTLFNLTVYAFGGPNRPARLFEDDGTTFDFESSHYNWITLRFPEKTFERAGRFAGQRYKIKSWERIG